VAIVMKDLYWLAGMMEGEGSFYLAGKKNQKTPNYYPELTVQTTDYDVAMRISNIMCNRLTKVKPYNYSRKQSYKVRLSSTRAIQWMMTLYPLLGNRRQEKIREIITFWKNSVDGRTVRYRK